jgi:chemotaxis protein MotB
MARLHKKPKHQEHENHERYLVTYSDLITLLLVFFIVMFSISNADKDKFLRVSTSIREAFRVDVLSMSDKPSGQGSSNLETDPQFVTYLAIRGQVATLVSRLQLSPDTASVEQTSDGVVIHLTDDVLFAPGDTQLRPDGKKLLDGLAQVIAPLPNEVRIEGHTDDVQPDGTTVDNWQLSVLRAVSAVEYLTGLQNIAPERMAAVGYGQYRPRADNSTLDGRRQNRSVDVLIVQHDVQGLDPGLSSSSVTAP